MAENDYLGVGWAEFKKWFGTAWQPGEHVAVVAPTGAGKTTLVGGLLDLRRYVLAVDPKGGDDTLDALDYRRLNSWPGNRRMVDVLDEDARKGRPSRFVLGPVVHTKEDTDKLKAAIGDGLDGAFDMGGWTVYIDELQVTADRRMFNMADKVDRLLVSARSKGVSVVSSFQQPRWVTSASMTQPTWLFTSYTRDHDTLGRIAELFGRPKGEIRGAVKGLERFCWMVVGRDPREPIRATKPDRIIPKKRSA